MTIGWVIAYAALWLAVIALGAIVLGLLRQITPLLERAAGGQENQAPRPPAHMSDGPSIGRPVPHFTASGPDGPLTDEQLLGQPYVLVFLSTGCGPCQQLAAELAGTDLGRLGDLSRQLVIVTDPDGQAELGIPASLRVLTQTARKEISIPLGVRGSPYAIAVGTDGTVASSRYVNTVDQLTGLAAVLA
jgi:hypothetical protein